MDLGMSLLVINLMMTALARPVAIGEPRPAPGPIPVPAGRPAQ
jgi:cytochrome c oxidase cbb3-type subunit 1